MVHIAESTVGRRYAWWFIKNTERTQRIYDELKSMPLPAPPKQVAVGPVASSGPANTTELPKRTGAKVAWGGVKVA